MNLPTSAACHEVPQAMIVTFFKLATSISTPSRNASLCSTDRRPRSVSVTARDCSWISFNMKCLNPAFSAETALQVISLASRVTLRPSRSVSSTPLRRTSAISPSSRNNMRLVCMRMAGTSEAMKFSPSPRPSTSGEAFLAATIWSGIESDMTTMA
jgi:hypothetical protein